MSARGFFITGTDTGVGKTQCSSLLIRACADQGYKVVGMKPVASGATVVMDKLRNEDALILMESANVEVPYDLVNPYCFSPPIAPHLAAQQSGIVIDLNTILESYKQLSGMADLLIVEGVGGWSVPLNDESDMSDLAQQFGLPVIMVVGIRLGCINHALLTAQSIQAKGCKLIGWIANFTTENVDVADENIKSLQARLTFPLLATIPYFSVFHNIDISNVFNFKTLQAILDN